MALFAGPVFVEWYWGPIFFLLLFGPPLAVAAFLVDLAVNRWVRRLRGLQRAGLWAGVIVGGALAIVGGREALDHLRFERESKAAARDLDFTPLAPRELPAAFDAGLVRADDEPDRPVLITFYDVAPAGYAHGYQQRAALVELAPGRCSLTRLAGTGTNFFDGPCEERRTRAGRRVFVGASRTITRGRDAFAVLDGTLVRLQSSGVAERDVLTWFDALRPIRPGEIDFKRG